MTGLVRWFWPFLGHRLTPSRSFPTSGFKLLDLTQRVEEENLAWYSPVQFYPARIGEVFRSRYQIVGKLGHGAYSTVWLCRDLLDNTHVTMKLWKRDASQARREVDIYRQLAKVRSRHVGSTLIRRMLDHFEIEAASGRHLCLIHEPLGMSLSKMRRKFRAKRLPQHILKLTVIHILLALQYLHQEAHIIHTDLQQNNILLGIEDYSNLQGIEDAEISHPSPRKILDGRVIHTSHDMSDSSDYGRPVLCDFGEARSAKMDHDDLIQPFLYRAPEVVLKMRWKEKVDIWNLGLLTWDLFEKTFLFRARDEQGHDSSEHLLAEMMGILGPPPKDFLARSPHALEYFDDRGTWRGQAEVPATSLEAMEENLQGTEQVDFLAFLRCMLQWAPERRMSAAELLAHPWLKSA